AGVFFHARIQHLENTPEHTYFTGLGVGQGQFVIGQPGPDSLNMAAWRNWLAKHLLTLCSTWLAQGEGFRPGDLAVEPARADLRAILPVSGSRCSAYSTARPIADSTTASPALNATSSVRPIATRPSDTLVSSSTSAEGHGTSPPLAPSAINPPTLISSGTCE